MSGRSFHVVFRATEAVWPALVVGAVRRLFGDRAATVLAVEHIGVRSAAKNSTSSVLAQTVPASRAPSYSRPP
jgi:hypothetical protein